MASRDEEYFAKVQPEERGKTWNGEDEEFRRGNPDLVEGQRAPDDRAQLKIGERLGKAPCQHRARFDRVVLRSRETIEADIGRKIADAGVLDQTTSDCARYRPP